MCCLIYQLLPPRENPVSSIFVGDMHLLLILQVSKINSRISSKVTTSPPNLGGLSPAIVTLTSGFSRPLAPPPPVWTPPAPCVRPPPAAIEPPIAFSWYPTPTTAAQCFAASEKQVGHVWAVSRTYPIQLNCEDSRPRARWYQLRRLPLVGSEGVFLNAIARSLSRGEGPSHRRSASSSISQELTRNS